MISSPCADCPKKNQSKYKCIKACSKLKEIQDYQVKNREEVFSNAIDYTKENSYVATSKSFV